MPAATGRRSTATALRAHAAGVGAGGGRCAWGHAFCAKVIARDDGTYDLVFDHGTMGPFDLVVGADRRVGRGCGRCSRRYQPPLTGGVDVLSSSASTMVDTRPSQTVAAWSGRGQDRRRGRRNAAMIVQRNGNAQPGRGYAIFLAVPAELGPSAPSTSGSPAKSPARGSPPNSNGWADNSRRPDPRQQ